MATLVRRGPGRGQNGHHVLFGRGPGPVRAIVVSVLSRALGRPELRPSNFIFTHLGNIGGPRDLMRGGRLDKADLGNQESKTSPESKTR